MTWLSNWWRGWSDEDVKSARRKVSENMRPGAIIFLTAQEFRAFVATSIILPR